MKRLILLISSFCFIISCQNGAIGTEETRPMDERPADFEQQERSLLEADRSISYKIFRETVAYDSDAENMMISPLSITMALAMAMNGAETETLEEMRQALALSEMELNEINEAFQSLIGYLSTADPKVTLTIANSLWHDHGLGVKNRFSERLGNYYEAEIRGLDFRLPGAPAEINSWVNDRTEGLISEIVEDIPEEVVLYLINAIYFKGDWAAQFDAEMTRSADFHLESGKTKEVQMMQKEDRFAIYRSDEVQMIEIPYGDSLFSMTVMMPASREMPIDRFIDQKMTNETVSEWRSSLVTGSRDVTLRLPKFELEYELEYSDILKAMGMEKAFNESKADFSGIADVSPQNLYISNVTHKTFIRVDEEGTEAAAVTDVGFGVTSVPPQLTFNRPFVFIIHEKEGGANLFMGRVKNPG